ncbi:MAG: hypothetical protein H6R10_2796 [Rhodocyclaceae bacterium]|nr:hypothetical protein [Rhodocyclaceae bacterium]
MNNDDLSEWAKALNLSDIGVNKLTADLSTLRQKQAQDIEQLRQEFGDAIETMRRALAKGVIPLKSLLQILASEEAIEAAKRGELNIRKIRKRVDLEHYEVSKCLLGNAKRAILAGRLIVRTLTAPHPMVNEVHGVQAWCKQNDTLLTPDEAAPHGRIVVSLDEAISWLKSEGIPLPAWLKASKAETRNPSWQQGHHPLMQLLLGMAQAGYGFDPAASRNNCMGDISKAVGRHTNGCDQDTVRKWLHRATQGIPPKPGRQEAPLAIALAMAMDCWRYTQSSADKVAAEISADLASKEIDLPPEPIKALLIEAEQTLHRAIPRKT